MNKNRTEKENTANQSKQYDMTGQEADEKVKNAILKKSLFYLG